MTQISNECSVKRVPSKNQTMIQLNNHNIIKALEKCFVQKQFDCRYIFIVSRCMFIYAKKIVQIHRSIPHLTVASNQTSIAMSCE